MVSNIKLKGKASKKLSPKDRAKKQDTLDRMEETRIKNGILLKDKIDKKVEWLKEQELKAIKQIKDNEIIVTNNKEQLQRIRGAIAVLEELRK